jgi:hypothetical protein
MREFSVAWWATVCIHQIVWLVYAVNKWIVEPISYNTAGILIINGIIAAIVFSCFLRELKKLKEWWNE